jgi:hypothetical protein
VGNVQLFVDKTIPGTIVGRVSGTKSIGDNYKINVWRITETVFRINYGHRRFEELAPTIGSKLNPQEEQLIQELSRAVISPY